MPFSLNDVHVLPWMTQDGSLTASPSSSPSKSKSYEGDDTSSNYKDYTRHANRHSDDSVFAAIPITAIVFTFIYLIVKAIMAPFTNRKRYAPVMQTGGGLSEEEVAILQKLQRTLSQMESRVEALETILIDQTRTEKHYGSKL